MTEQLYQLVCSDEQAAYPVWRNAAFVTLVGMLRLNLPESDLEEDNPLPYGHLAFVEDGAQIWVCRAWHDGRELGQMVVQFSADRGRVHALHDWQLKEVADAELQRLLLALMAGARPGVQVVAADAAMQQRLQQLLGGLPFDLHNCTRLYWTSHAQACCP